jgi:flagellar hook-associated protein 1 FlgK
MSIPTLQGLQTALSGLLAEQSALDVTGNNIANANTEGYSRETAVLQPNPPLDIPAISTLTGQGAQLGTGVGVQTITRIRNTYLDAQYRAQNSALNSSSTQAEVLGQAQAAFNEPTSASIAGQLSAFWTAWNSLAASPTGEAGEAAKVGVAAAGEQLAKTFNELSAQLSTISTQTTEQFNALAGPSGEVHNLATQIAQLNGQIRLSEEAGEPPNSMLDRRDLLLDKLSSLANVSVTEEADHTDTVSFGDAAEPLVEGTNVNWPQAITEAAGGELGALLNLTGPKGALTGLETGLDGVAETLATTVNAQLTTPFFSGTTAATLAVAVTPGEVQASRTGAAGNNEAALAVADLRGGAAEEGYATLVEQLGSDVQDAKDEQTNLQTTVTAINDQRQAVSGVSLDEEMTNLITFQRGYQASARTMTAMDEMLDTLINHTGVAGL